MLPNFHPYSLQLHNRALVVDHPLVMGIVNVTPDSFYSESRTFSEASIEERVAQMLFEGVDIFDLGAYSTRPGAAEVSPGEELRRLRMGIAVVKRLAPDMPISVDTFRADVARECVEQYGADIINDVSGGTLDAQMAATAGRLGVPYILMHMRGTPATMQQFTQYGPDGVTADVMADLKAKMAHFAEQGCTQIIVDPGFGFSKTLEQNYEMMRHLADFHQLHAPLLVGISRKSMIYRLLGSTPQESLQGTTVLNTLALLAGTHILRVHDVRAAVEARRLLMQTYASK